MARCPARCFTTWPEVQFQCQSGGMQKQGKDTLLGLNKAALGVLVLAGFLHSKPIGLYLLPNLQCYLFTIAPGDRTRGEIICKHAC